MTGSLEISAGSRLANFWRKILGRVFLRPKICAKNLWAAPAEISRRLSCERALLAVFLQIKNATWG